MNLIRYDDPLIFKSDIQEHLLKHEAENNLVLGILANIIDGEYQDQPPFLAQVEDEKETRLVVMRTPPFPALMSYNPEPIEDRILQLITNSLYEAYGEELSGITAAKRLAIQMAEAWQKRTHKTPELKMAMRIYKLTRVNPITGVSGRMRPANDDDVPLVQEWYGNFHRDALREEPDPDLVRNQVNRFFEADPSQRGLMIWEDGGKPVSMAGYTGPTANGIRIGAVYTPPKLRRKGYASACTAGLSQYLLDSGFQFCFLFTDLINPTSNHIYQQIGYKPVTDVDTYDFR